MTLYYTLLKARGVEGMTNLLKLFLFDYRSSSISFVAQAGMINPNK